MRTTDLPGPFEWVTIPGGEVTLKAGGYLEQPATFEIAPFTIARYPITNRQYALFIAEGGYANPAWWSEYGWRVRERQGWIEPRYWGQRDFDGDDSPVMGVTWHEAGAFCCWLSAATGEPVTLPTEQQWQRAAQGDDGREFPWGSDDPDETRCNWARNVDGTTPVTQYPLGASPYGVMDLSGNVWEICRTSWDSGGTHLDGAERRIVRGGCWVNDSPITLMVTQRDGPHPADTYHLFGFRCTLENGADSGQ